MLLVIDAGNSDIVFALHKNEKWIHHWRIPTSTQMPKEVWPYRLRSEMLELGYNISSIDQTIISSVVPHLNQPLVEMLEILLGESPLLLGPGSYSPLKVKVMNPKEIGSDLVANAAAAYHRFKGKCIVVDFGTALTFTTIGENGKILGVSIAPGLTTAIRSLFDSTAQLPEVPLELPTSALGTNTIHAIQSGVLIGYTGMVIHMIQRIKNEIGENCKVIATGGLSSILTSLEKEFDDIDQMLTLEGLVVIAGELRNKV